MENKNWLFTLLRNSTDLDPIDGEPTVLEWNNFPGHTTLQLRSETQRTMSETNLVLQKFKDRNIFMSMYNDIDWEKKNDRDICIVNSQMVTASAAELPKGHWSFPGLGYGETCYETHTCKPDGQWNQIDWTWWLLPVKVGILCCEHHVRWIRGALKSKGGGKLTRHHCGDSESAKPLFRNFVSVNQPRIHWAASDRCKEHSLSASNTASRELINDATHKCMYLDELTSHRRRSIKRSDNSWSYKQIEQFKENRKFFLSFVKQNSRREFFLKNKRITYSHEKDTNACGRKGGLTKLNHWNNIWVSNFLRIPQEMEELKKAQNWKWQNNYEKVRTL